MDVIHILWSGEIGGKERAVYQLVRHQIGHSRFTPAVAFCQAHGPYVQKVRELGCTIVDLQMRSGADITALPAIISKLRPYHLHHFHSAEPTVMLGSSLCRGAKRFYTHRGGQPSFNLRQRLKYRFLGLLLRSHFAGLSANTRHATFSGSCLTGIPVQRWTVTYNGMDFRLLEPKVDPGVIAGAHGLLPNQRTIIGTTAHLRSWKRIEYLLQACATLPKTEFQILIVGDGPDRGRLETIAHSLGLGSNTVFAGMQTDIGAYLAVMDIFVLPSGPQESFGNSAIEAMAVGLPTVVFSDGGGLPEHVQDAHTGYVVDSVGELSSRLNQLLSNPDLRTTLGETAATHIQSTYDLNAMTSCYDAFYRSHTS